MKMPLNVNDFNVTDRHPAGMLKGVSHAFEKECNLVIMLNRAIEAGDIHAVIEMKHDHPTMVSDGLIECVGEKKYKLTTKSIGLLYGEYAK